MTHKFHGIFRLLLLVLAVIMVFPQSWLLRRMTAMILFWVTSIMAVAEILVFVCRQCENRGCLMCPHKEVSRQ